MASGRGEGAGSVVQMINTDCVEVNYRGWIQVRFKVWFEVRDRVWLEVSEHPVWSQIFFHQVFEKVECEVWYD